MATTFRFTRTAQPLFSAYISHTANDLPHFPWTLKAGSPMALCTQQLQHRPGHNWVVPSANKSNNNSFFSSSSWNQKEFGPGFWAHFPVSKETSYAFPERKVLVLLGLEMMGKETGSHLSEILCVRLWHVPHVTRWDPGRSWKCEIEAYETYPQLILMQPLMTFPHQTMKALGPMVNHIGPQDNRLTLRLSKTRENLVHPT